MTSADPKYVSVCELIVNSGGTPLPVSDTLVEIIRLILTDDEVDFLLVFQKGFSQSLDQMMENTGLDETAILTITDQLAKKGVIFNQPSSSGLKVFRLLPLINVGIFEYMFMKKLEYTDKARQIGALFSKLFQEHRIEVQKDYAQALKTMERLPPLDRTIPIQTNLSTGGKITIPIHQSIEPEERFMKAQNVADLIEKFDEIAVGHCFCRQHKDIMNESCKQTDLRETCFTFGKSARFTSAQGFMRMIDKKEALEILLQTEKDGLVHKAYHPKFDVSKDETSICNCCKCCCTNNVFNQREPLVNLAGFLPEVDLEACIGCGVCVDRCFSEAIHLNDDQISEVDPSRCVGCGACAHFCPEEAIRLVENERIIRIPPPKES